MRTNIVEEFAQEQDAEIQRLRKANADLLADSKRHEEVAADRLRILQAKYPDSERLLVTEIARPRKIIVEKDKSLRNANKYVRLLGTHLLNKRLGKLGLHQNNQKSFEAYKALVDTLDRKGLSGRAWAWATGATKQARATARKRARRMVRAGVETFRREGALRPSARLPRSSR